MIHAKQNLGGVSSKKQSSCERRAAERLISSPVQKSPSGYRHAGEASLWLCSKMQVRQWRRNLKDNGADSTFSFHLLLHFGSHPSSWFSLSLPAMVAQAVCASLYLSLRRYQAEAAWESERLTLNQHASGRNAGPNRGENHFPLLFLTLRTLLRKGRCFCHWLDVHLLPLCHSKVKIYLGLVIPQEVVDELDPQTSNLTDSAILSNAGRCAAQDTYLITLQKMLTLICRMKTHWQKAGGVPQPPSPDYSTKSHITNRLL